MKKKAIVITIVICVIVLCYALTLTATSILDNTYIYYDCCVSGKCISREKYYLNTDFVENQQTLTIGVQETTYNTVNVGDEITIRVSKLNLINSKTNYYLTLPYYEFVCVNN